MEEQTVIKEGLIRKYINIVKGYKKRYFVLYSDMLVYYRSMEKTDEDPKKIHLKWASIIPNKNEAITIDTGTHTFKLKFENISDKIAWLNALKATQKHYEDIDPTPRGSFPKESKNSDTSVPDFSQNDLMRSNTFDRSDSQQMPAHSVEKRVVAESIRSVLKSKSDVVKISESKMLRKSVLNYHKGLGNLEMCEKLDKTLIKNMHDVYQSFATMDQNLYHIKTRAEEEKDQKLKTHSDNIEKEQQNIKNIMTASFQKMKDFLEAFKTVQESSSSKEDCNTFQNSEVKEENQVSDEGRGSHINPDADQSEQVDQADQKVADDDDSDNDTIFYDAYDAMILSELEQEVERGPKIDQTEEEKVEEERLTLPALKSEGKFSLLKVLKDAVGRDLTKFWVPVYFNEPLSMLQKTAELMCHDHLMKKAYETQDPMLRLSYVSAIVISHYSLTTNRVTKPFNPILGETFEMMGNGWRLLAEQVSHHPPVSALVVQAEKYEIRMNTSMSQQFWGKSMEFKPQGRMHFIFHDTGDHFIVQRPNTSVRNIIFGTMYIDHHGKMLVTNVKTNDYAEFEFHKSGKSLFGKGKKTGTVDGKGFDSNGICHYLYKGLWNENFSFWPFNPDVKDFDHENSALLWEIEPKREDWERIYYFSKFALQLNNLTPELKKKIAPTDCRFRPDQRALENGDLTVANSEKHRLEEKQRDSRKKRTEEGIEWVPNYFEKYHDEYTDLDEYRYWNDYWKDREESNWSHLPDLYSEE